MRAVTIVLACLIALATGHFRFGGKALQALTLARNECFASENVDPGYINRLDSADLPAWDELQCHSLCVFKKFNAINDAGVYNLEVFKPYIPEAAQEHVFGVVHRCLLDIKDPCRNAYEVHRCFNDIVYKLR